jgi:hypothetical protein
VRRTAVWISERFLKTHDEEMIKQLATLKNDPSANVQTQFLLSLSYCKSPNAKIIADNMVATATRQKPMFDMVANSIEVNKNTFLFGSRLANMPAANRNLVLNGETIYKQLCSSCHAADGKGLMVGDSMAGTSTFSITQVDRDKNVLVKNFTEWIIWSYRWKKHITM